MDGSGDKKNDVIDEENLEDSSPERIPSLKKMQSLNKQNPGRSRQNSMLVEPPQQIVVGQPPLEKSNKRNSEPYILENNVDLIKKISLNILPEKTAVKTMGSPTAAADSIISMALESEVYAGHGPPQSFNQSEYSLLKNLVDKALKSPKNAANNNSSIVAPEANSNEQQQAQEIAALKS